MRLYLYIKVLSSTKSSSSHWIANSCSAPCRQQTAMTTNTITTRERIYYHVRTHVCMCVYGTCVNGSCIIVRDGQKRHKKKVVQTLKQAQKYGQIGTKIGKYGVKFRPLRPICQLFIAQEPDSIDPLPSHRSVDVPFKNVSKVSDLTKIWVLGQSYFPWGK